MRRRRRKNPLLGRIIMISIAAHIVALPILAHFGTFRAIQRRYFDTQLVVLAPPKLQEEQKQPKSVAKHEHTAAKRTGGAKSGQAHHAPSNLPPVVASNAGPGGDEGPSIDSAGTGHAGMVPNNNAPKPDNGAGSDGGDTQPKPQPQDDKPPVKPADAPFQPQPKPPADRPADQPKRVPVFRDAEATYAPKPTIPDELRYDAVDKTTVVQFTVGPDGSPTDVRVAETSGVPELDKAALETAKQWKFKPATRDGEAISRVVRLRVEFKVE